MGISCKDPDALTEKQRRFVEEYLIDCNARGAYERAGYKISPNEPTNKSNAQLILRSPKVAAAIEAAKTKRSEKVNITAEMVLERLWAIATADPQALMQLRRAKCPECGGSDTAQCPVCRGEGTIPDPWFADTREVPEQARRLFAGVKVTKEGIEVKTHDQMRALEMVARHLGMFTDKVDVNVTGTLVERLLRGRERLKHDKRDD